MAIQEKEWDEYYDEMPDEDYERFMEEQERIREEEMEELVSDQLKEVYERPAEIIEEDEEGYQAGDDHDGTEEQADGFVGSQGGGEQGEEADGDHHDVAADGAGGLAEHFSYGELPGGKPAVGFAGAFQEVNGEIHGQAEG